MVKVPQTICCQRVDLIIFSGTTTVVENSRTVCGELKSADFHVNVVVESHSIKYWQINDLEDNLCMTYDAAVSMGLFVAFLHLRLGA